MLRLVIIALCAVVVVGCAVAYAFAGLDWKRSLTAFVAAVFAVSALCVLTRFPQLVQ